MTLKADVEGAEDVEKKTIEIKFEKKKMWKTRITPELLATTVII